MNAKVGEDNNQLNKIMGKNGLGKRYENGEIPSSLLLKIIALLEELFKHKTIHKTTWESPDGHTKSQIDHVMISQTWRRSL